MQNELAAIKDSYQEIRLSLKRVDRMKSSIMSICELVQPTLVRIANEDGEPNYFDLNRKQLRWKIEDRENTMCHAANVIRSLDDIAMDIDSETGNISSVLDTVASVLSQINVDDNQTANGVSVDRKQGGR